MYKSIPIYNEDEILQAIEEEGLYYGAYGHKCPGCIFIFTEGKEKHEIWDKFPTPLHGYELAPWDANTIEPVDYYLIKGSYKGQKPLIWEKD